MNSVLAVSYLLVLVLVNQINAQLTFSNGWGGKRSRTSPMAVDKEDHCLLSYARTLAAIQGLIDVGWLHCNYSPFTLRTPLNSCSDWMISSRSRHHSYRCYWSASQLRPESE